MERLRRGAWALGAVLALAAVGYAGYQLSAERPQRSQARVGIRLPPDAVFPYLLEPRHLTRWVAGLEQTQRITPGDARVGARTQEIVAIDGRRFQLESEITAYEPGRRLALTVDNQGFTTTATYTLVPDPQGTTLKLVQDITYHIWLAQLFAPLLALPVQQRLAGDLERLKALVEADARRAP